MNLKSFHIVFITISLLLAVFLAVWGLSEYNKSGDSTQLIIGIGSAVLLLPLALYGRWILKKFKTLPELMLVVSCLALGLIPCLPTVTWACAVCFNAPDSDLTKGAQAGVAFLGIMVYGLLLGIGAIALSWARRARAQSAHTKPA